MTKLKVPVVSRELDFFAQNAVVVEDVLDSAKGPLLSLTEAVLTRAESDVDEILRKLEPVVSKAAKSIVRIDWVNTNRGENWHSWGRVFTPIGPKKRIASIGLYLDNEPMPLRLIAWLWPWRGGLDGRRELVRVCHKKVGNVLLASEHLERYPAWADDDGIVWYERKILSKTLFENLLPSLGTRAKKFLKAAKPVLIKLKAA
jgi:hypothetical protein